MINTQNVVYKVKVTFSNGQTAITLSTPKNIARGVYKGSVTAFEILETVIINRVRG